MSSDMFTTQRAVGFTEIWVDAWLNVFARCETPSAISGG